MLVANELHLKYNNGLPSCACLDGEQLYSKSSSGYVSSRAFACCRSLKIYIATARNSIMSRSRSKSVGAMPSVQYELLTGLRVILKR